MYEGSFKGWFNAVSRKFEEFFLGISRIFQGSFKSASKVLDIFFKGDQVSRFFQLSYRGVSRKFSDC